MWDILTLKSLKPPHETPWPLGHAEINSPFTFACTFICTAMHLHMMFAEFEAVRWSPSHPKP